MAHNLWSRFLPILSPLSCEDLIPSSISPDLQPLQIESEAALSQCRMERLIHSLVEAVPESILAYAQPGSTDRAAADILRLDRVDSLESPHAFASIGGNKLFKLSGHIEAFEHSTNACLLSFGGRWSNHLHALAALAQRLGIPAIGYVRGYVDQPLTATLQDCLDMGMTLHFCDKITYAKRYDESWQQQLSNQHNAWVIPEGGEGDEGLLGFGVLAPVLTQYDEIWLAAGTGTSARGVAALLTSKQKLVVINALADDGALKRKWRQLGANQWSCDWDVIGDASMGGFGKCPSELREFIAMADAANLPLEPVYTAKLVFAYVQRQLNNRLSKQESQAKRLLIHTGGLQGRRGYSF